MIELNVQDLRKKALIKFSGAPDGHVFGVRRQTPGDELALSELFREKAKLIEEASEIDKNIKENRDTIDVNVENKKIEKIIKKMDELGVKELSIHTRIFDDFGDGTLARKLYLELSEDDRNALINAVMSDQNIVKEEKDA